MPLRATLRESEWQHFLEIYKVSSETMKVLLLQNYGIEEIKFVPDLTELPRIRVNFTPAGPPFN